MWCPFFKTWYVSSLVALSSFSSSFFWWFFLSFGFPSCPFSPTTAWALDVDPLVLFIYVFLGPICIGRSLSFCNIKLLFVYFWIALFKTFSTLPFNIYFLFSFNGVLSSLLGVALPNIEILKPGFNEFYQKIGRSFKWNIFFKGKHLLQLYLWTKAPWHPCSLPIPLLVCPPHGNLGRAWL